MTLANGRRVFVDERFLRQALLDPGANAVKGYPSAPMIRALARLDLAAHPQQTEDLIAFMEQVGPETG